MLTPQFLNKKDPIAIWGTHLPHWYQPEKTVFITFRLADSLPASKRKEITIELLNIEEETNKENKKARQKAIMNKMEQWLNSGYGLCLLAQSEIRSIVEKSLRYYDDNEWHLHAYVIMPNHIHILATPIAEKSCQQIINNVKSYTQHCVQTEHLWQKGAFDHTVRNEESFKKIINYIADNPKHLPQSSFTLYVEKESDYLLG